MKLSLPIALVLLTLPALADSAPPPPLMDYSMNYPGTFTIMPVNTIPLLFLGTAGATSGLYQSLFLIGVWNAGQLFHSTLVVDDNVALGSADVAGGTLYKATLSSSDVLSGYFSGFEEASVGSTIAYYNVKGIFSEDLNFTSPYAGTLLGGSLILTSATYKGVTNVPEPSTWALLATGLLGIVAKVWKPGVH